MNRQHPLERRIFAGFLRGFIVLAAELLITTAIILNIGLEKSFESNFEAQATALSARIETMKTDNTRIAHWFANNGASVDIIRTMDSVKALQNAANAKGSFGFDDFSYFDKTGIDIATGKRVSSDLVNIALEGKTKVDYLADAKSIALETSTPVTHNGRIIGGVYIRERLSTRNTVDAFKTQFQSDITFFAGETRVETTLVGPDGKRMTGTKLENKAIIDRVFKRGETYQGINTLAGSKYITVYYPLKNRDGTVVGCVFAGQSFSAPATIMASIYRIVAPLTILFIIILLIMYLVELKSLVFKPLDAVGSAMENLASGHADLTFRMKVTTDDEIGKIAGNINVFMELLQSLMQEIRLTQESLVVIGEELGANAEKSAGSISQIMSNIEGIRQQSRDQDESVKKTNDVVSQSLSTVGTLDGHIRNQAAGITESSASIEEMVGNIGAVTLSIRKMTEQFQSLMAVTEKGKENQSEVDSRVNKIADQSRLLLEANAIISKIAAQTNLLAMNAAIEAAHAGSAGMGFSVVADEIRNLAETSSKQSKAINTELKQISLSIEEVVKASRESQDSFGSVVDQITATGSLVREIDAAMIEQKEASKQILEALRDMNESSADVQEESRTLTEGVNVVSGEMANVTQIAKAILASMDEMTLGAKEINAAARVVSDLAAKTRESIKTMDEQLNKLTL